MSQIDFADAVELGTWTGEPLRVLNPDSCADSCAVNPTICTRLLRIWGGRGFFMIVHSQRENRLGSRLMLGNCTK